MWFGCGEIGRSGSSVSDAVSALSSLVKATLTIELLQATAQWSAVEKVPSASQAPGPRASGSTQGRGHYTPLRAGWGRSIAPYRPRRGPRLSGAVRSELPA